MKNLISRILKNKYVNILIVSLIILNVIVFIFETDPEFYKKFEHQIVVFEAISVFVFTVEYVFRLILLKRPKEFFKPLLLIDLLAILPFYLSFFIVDTMFIRIARLARLIRLFKLNRYTSAYNNIFKTFLFKKYELLVTASLFFFVIVFSSILMYYVEGLTGHESFSTIPSCFWWAVITVTSVGYGDVVPITTLGKVIGSFTALMGVGLHGVFIGVVGSAFIDGLKKNKREYAISHREPPLSRESRYENNSI